jgi:N-acetylated-alpha-linked acidic dipeptidase
MRRLGVFLLSAIVLILAPVAPAAQAPAQAKPWDAVFRDIPQPDNIRTYMQRMSARPHHVGSPYDKDNAEWIKAQFTSWGWDAQIETFSVLFPTPKERLVELVSPTTFTAKLQEPPVGPDPTSNQTAEQLPTYNAYSIDGDVTGPLVYVNYGRPEDYDVLERQGVSVKGAIVVSRYGGSWRGIKPKVAGEHGAVGCLIYSDPKDDGFYGDDVFPAGPMRPKDGVQRGSVMDMPLYTGDPLTPGVGATPSATRLAIKDAPTITKIPVLPISYADAQPLLAAMTGPVAPEDWRGALPITYHLGPGTGRVHLKVSSNWDMKPLYDVIARIPGSTFPDEWVIRGNHHDAWVNGAEDPLSGTSSELEEARALGELVKQGWRPKRTIVYAAWDGEEPGLLGSTEWAETHATELRQHAAIYINSDTNSRGYLGMSGSHSLEHFINQVARDVTDPETGQSVWRRVQARSAGRGGEDGRGGGTPAASGRGAGGAGGGPDLPIGALGSGSDYTPFLQHLGVPSLNLGFGGEDQTGIYHSVYDDFYFYTHFLDTKFVYERALAQTVGTAIIRLADADVLPYEYTDLASTVNGYVSSLQALLEQQQNEARARNRNLEAGVFAETNDPQRSEVAPKLETVPPALDFAPLQNAATALTDAAGAYERALSAARSRLAGESDQIKAINQKLLGAEQQFLDPSGLPHREWYKHMLYAPGFYTGYGVKTMPAVRESIEQKDYGDTNAQIARTAAAVDREAKWLTSITAMLNKQ